MILNWHSWLKRFIIFSIHFTNFKTVLPSVPLEKLNISKNYYTGLLFEIKFLCTCTTLKIFNLQKNAHLGLFLQSSAVNTCPKLWEVFATWKESFINIKPYTYSSLQSRKSYNNIDTFNFKSYLLNEATTTIKVWPNTNQSLQQFKLASIDLPIALCSHSHWRSHLGLSSIAACSTSFIAAEGGLYSSDKSLGVG